MICQVREDVQEKRPGCLIPLSEIQKGVVSDLGVPGTPSLPTEILGTVDYQLS